jgi:hypothetical protein
MTSSSGLAQHGGATPGMREPANLADILERVLDRGLVIVGDIRVSLLDIELLTVKLRLLVASVDTARQLGINWWESDPWLTARPAAPAVAGSDRSELGDASRPAVESHADAEPARAERRPEWIDERG